MTYAHSGGDLMLVGPRTHRLQPNEALDLLDAHRQAYRANFEAGDLLTADHETHLSSQLAGAIEAQKLWRRAASPKGTDQ